MKRKTRKFHNLIRKLKRKDFACNCYYCRKRAGLGPYPIQGTSPSVIDCLNRGDCC